MKLFFDTETTGKADFNRPHTDKSQPRMVSCAAVLIDPDFKEVASARLIVKPDGWEIPEQVSSIHGITTEYASRVGAPVLTVLSVFFHMAKAANELIAFNYDFDRIVLDGEFHRAGKPSPFSPVKAFCEMKAMTLFQRRIRRGARCDGGCSFND